MRQLLTAPPSLPITIVMTQGLPVAPSNRLPRWQFRTRMVFGLSATVAAMIALVFGAYPIYEPAQDAAASGGSLLLAYATIAFARYEKNSWFFVQVGIIVVTLALWFLQYTFGAAWVPAVQVSLAMISFAIPAVFSWKTTPIWANADW